MNHQVVVEIILKWISGRFKSHAQENIYTYIYYLVSFRTLGSTYITNCVKTHKESVQAIEHNQKSSMIKMDKNRYGGYN